MTSVSVNIKMYKVGELGDCFLLRFVHGNDQSHILIDCGSFQNSNASKARMTTIATDIKTQLNQNKLNAIVGTHQHNDHLSGFVHAQPVFEDIANTNGIEQVWFSWLDNPKDKQAVRIGTDYNNFLLNLRRINLRLNSITGLDGVKETKEIIDSILGFYGIDSAAGLSATDDTPPVVPALATKFLRTLGSKKPKYLVPGKIFNLPGLPADIVKVYVLGPPKKNEPLLFDVTPTDEETFDPELALANTQAMNMLSALTNFSNTDDKGEAQFPFNSSYKKSAGANNKNIPGSYNKGSEKWRKIDRDWLRQAERLALWIDGFTNNSSLVLAFELVKSEKVLLFVGDAQTGNWNSWREIEWKNAPAGFNWLSLLNNTVLYKVGHHASHNATLVEGLHAMTHDELIAMIPVDKSDFHITPKPGSKSKPWRMPAENLYRELKKQTKNRVLRMEDGFADECKPTKEPAKSSWKKLPFLPKINAMFIEYEVKG